MQNTNSHVYFSRTVIVMALCLYYSVTMASPAAVDVDPVLLSGHLPRSQDAIYAMNVTEAHEFAQSYKVH